MEGTQQQLLEAYINAKEKVDGLVVKLQSLENSGTNFDDIQKYQEKLGKATRILQALDVACKQVGLDEVAKIPRIEELENVKEPKGVKKEVFGDTPGAEKKNISDKKILSISNLKVPKLELKDRTSFMEIEVKPERTSNDIKILKSRKLIEESDVNELSSLTQRYEKEFRIPSGLPKFRDRRGSQGGYDDPQEFLDVFVRTCKASGVKVDRYSALLAICLDNMFFSSPTKKAHKLFL